MSFMRSPLYAYVGSYDADGNDFVQIHSDDASIQIPLDLFDALVLMRYAQLLDPGKEHSAQELQAAINALNAIDAHGRGNFGSHSILERMGENPGQELADYLRRVREAQELAEGTNQQ